MSKLVTIAQKKILEKLGCKSINLVVQRDRNVFASIKQLITISEALYWIREEKGIDCCVFFNNELFGNLDNAKAIWYYKYGCNGRIIYNSWNVDYKSFDTHLLAESSLLDAVLDYLSIK